MFIVSLSVLRPWFPHFHPSLMRIMFYLSILNSREAELSGVEIVIASFLVQAAPCDWTEKRNYLVLE